MHATKLDTFTRAYIEAALWSSTDDAGEPLDANYDQSDLAPEALERMSAECRQFQSDNADDIAAIPDRGQWSADELAGHDFWLTRNGHGAGFWDRGLGELGERLTAASKAYGECDLYVGDDGRLYF